MALDTKQKRATARILVVLGACAAVGGIVALVLALGASRELGLLEASTPAAPRDLGAGADLAGAAVRVRGVARSADAAVSKVDGVSYIFADEEVQHHYQRERSTSTRRAKRGHRSLWSWKHAVDWFTVEWGGACVAVLGNAIVEVEPETRAPESRTGELRFGNLVLPAPPIRAHERVELERENIRNGAEVVVLGVARPTAEGPLAITPDDNGTLIVSTLSDELLARRLSSRENVALIFFGAGALVGIGLIAGGVVLHRGAKEAEGAARAPPA